jgi:hypothetical protein
MKNITIDRVARAMLITAALLSLTTAADASVAYAYECGAARIVPAERSDRNPVIKTKILAAFTVSDKFTNFEVEHYTADGAVYKRAEQYRDIKLQSTKKHELWSGVSIVNPTLTMVGTLSEVNVKGQKQTHYVERQYRGGKLVVTITSVCRGIDLEDE